MTTKLLVMELEKPIDCPYRHEERYYGISSNWMMYCGLKSGIVCTDRNNFCEGCPLEDYKK